METLPEFWGLGNLKMHSQHTSVYLTMHGQSQKFLTEIIFISVEYLTFFLNYGELVQFQNLIHSLLKTIIHCNSSIINDAYVSKYHGARNGPVLTYILYAQFLKMLTKIIFINNDGQLKIFFKKYGKSEQFKSLIDSSLNASV